MWTKFCHVTCISHFLEKIRFHFSGRRSNIDDAADQNLDMEFSGNEIEPELENLIQNSFEDRMNDLKEVLKNHESRLDQMDFIQNELKRIDTIISDGVSWTRFGATKSYQQYLNPF